MQKLAHPLVLETIMASTPLVKDVGILISIYSVELGYDRNGSGGYDFYKNDVWESIGNVSVPFLGHRQLSIDCLWRNDKSNRDSRVYVVLGKVEQTDIFVYRRIDENNMLSGLDAITLLSMNLTSENALWMVSYDLNNLLLQMSPTHLDSFISSQHALQLKKLFPLF